MRNGARTVLVLCALAVGVVPLPLGSNGIAVAWAFLGVVFGATFAPTLWRRYGISHRPLQAITGTSLALVGGVAGWALAIASALFVYSLVVAVGGFFLWIPVGLLAGVLTLPRLQSTGTGVIPPSKTMNSASSQRDRSTVHIILSVTAAGVWSIPTAVSIMWVGEYLYGDMFIEALGGLLAQIFFVFSDASAFLSPTVLSRCLPQSLLDRRLPVSAFLFVSCRFSGSNGYYIELGRPVQPFGSLIHLHQLLRVSVHTSLPGTSSGFP